MKKHPTRMLGNPERDCRLGQTRSKLYAQDPTEGPASGTAANPVVMRYTD